MQHISETALRRLNFKRTSGFISPGRIIQKVQEALSPGPKVCEGPTPINTRSKNIAMPKSGKGIGVVSFKQTKKIFLSNTQSTYTSRIQKLKNY